MREILNNLLVVIRMNSFIIGVTKPTPTPTPSERPGQFPTLPHSDMQS